MNATNLTNVRWATDRLADGACHAYAYLAKPEGEHCDPFVSVKASSGSELEALDALRVELCKHFRKPLDSSVTNSRGDRINVGGGYR
jgi:hypothetical protein